MLVEVIGFASALAAFGLGFPVGWNYLDRLEARYFGPEKG